VPRIAAVSCNPASFARDARILLDGGCRLERVVPVDQFVYSAETEVVGLFARSG
jgi:23S rRNA (uracil1939-C5)-methyltransferase